MEREPGDGVLPTASATPCMNTDTRSQAHEDSRAKIIAGSGKSLNGIQASSVRPLAVAEPNTNVGMETKFPKLDMLRMSKPIKYGECLKNHAASLGRYALDGCREFMPGGVEGTLEALKCAACDCHRNFHRREVEGDNDLKLGGLLAPLVPSPALTPAPPLRSSPPQRTMMPLPLQNLSPQGAILMGGASSGRDDPDWGPLLSSQPSFQAGAGVLRKRLRTKFTSEQKERMWDFAEKLGWRIQKHDEETVEQFCAEVGVKRHVLKVWMHNNKNPHRRKPSAS
ncbi:hypothetical protein KP509_35G000900 [Ceratopteris richardii]|uniref:ZF-HD dimerization-type domain-containing protein n=2 Tax=Ceratopteris richardii TaxID=49495 RepID=A0A8T2QDX9_CERRI|nr:hypothetical protein KP509_35G000900 [Ceratopteris richardii]